MFKEFECKDIALEGMDEYPNMISDNLCKLSDVVRAYCEDPYVLRIFTKKLLHEIFIEGVGWLEEHTAQYALPCLMLHGEEDKIIPYAMSEGFLEKIASTDKRFILYPNMYHEILSEKAKDTVIADIVAWLDERVQG